MVGQSGRLMDSSAQKQDFSVTSAARRGCAIRTRDPADGSEERRGGEVFLQNQGDRTAQPCRLSVMRRLYARHVPW